MRLSPNGRRIAAVTLIIQAANTSPTPHPDHAMMTMNGLLGRQAPEDFDAHDLSYITRIAAIGDSYSAGIGAGDRLGTPLEIGSSKSDWSCSRYSMAYPVILNDDPRLGDPSRRTFQFKSCSGAVTKDIIEKQIPDISSNQQVILLSAGGNDVQLINVLNHCIYQWASLQKTQGVLAKIENLRDRWPFNKLSFATIDELARTCDEQLDYTQALIDGAEFSRNLDAVIDAAKRRLAPGGRIYYTGYAKFFDIELTRNCDRVSWSVFELLTKTYNLHHEEQYLTSNHRGRMNSLVNDVNAKLKAAVDRAGSSVEFVNYDDYVGRFGGRFCEPGVDESASGATERPELMFYELNKQDPWGKNPWKRSYDSEMDSTFKGQMEIFIRLVAELDPGARLIRGEDGQQSARLGELEANATEDADAMMRLSLAEIDTILPDGYGRVFHPQVALHQIIANLVLFRMTNHNRATNNVRVFPEIGRIDSCPLIVPPESYLIPSKKLEEGVAVGGGVGLRILPLGDSITYGEGSERNNGGGNGYRLRLRENLSGNRVTYVGTESRGTMSNGNFAAWPGRNIEAIMNNMVPSLRSQPNVVLLHAGTNDMDDRRGGNDPAGAVSRLGKLIETVLDAVPDAVVLVAMIIPTCDPHKMTSMPRFQSLIPGLAKSFRDKDQKVLAVDFTRLPLSQFYDCIHPTNDGYEQMADWWYDYLTQIPDGWIESPEDDQWEADSQKNGGIATNIPRPDRGSYPVRKTSHREVALADDESSRGGRKLCEGIPQWKGAGQIANGVGNNGDWKFSLKWEEAGQVASGITYNGERKPGNEITLVDMDGDGRADYVWLDSVNGVPVCWLNRLREHAEGTSRLWVPAGAHSNGKIGEGTNTPGREVYLADANGDGLADYLILNPDNGAIHVWWNRGPQADANNGWKWERGGRIAVGARHANLATLRFPDINGDGRADYVFIGEGGALHNWMNTGRHGGTDVKWINRGGIATGEVSDLRDLVFADIDGDGKDDYLIWADDQGALGGYLNQQSNKEGSPVWVSQGSDRSLAKGTGLDRRTTWLVDMDGDGKADYAHIDDMGRVHLWYNRGTTDNYQVIDGIRFADINGDGRDDYIALDHKTGAARTYLNRGQSDDSNDDTLFGWMWEPINGGRNMIAGAGRADTVQFADINGDGRADYLVVHPETGNVRAWINEGRVDSDLGWRFRGIGTIFQGDLGPGKNVRLADIDGDGYADYIYLSRGGRARVWRNRWNSNRPTETFTRWSRGDASGIGQRPEEISFFDIDGDGKADYVWTNSIDGSVRVWYNYLGPYYGDYENTWFGPPDGYGFVVAAGVGTAGANVRFAYLQRTGRATYIAVNRETGGIAAWFNGCEPDHLVDVPELRSSNRLSFYNGTNIAVGNGTTNMREEIERRRNRGL